jgi:hypothetical protein
VALQKKGPAHNRPKRRSLRPRYRSDFVVHLQLAGVRIDFLPGTVADLRSDDPPDEIPRAERDALLIDSEGFPVGREAPILTGREVQSSARSELDGDRMAELNLVLSNTGDFRWVRGQVEGDRNVAEEVDLAGMLLPLDPPELGLSNRAEEVEAAGNGRAATAGVRRGLVKECFWIEF